MMKTFHLTLLALIVVNSIAPGLSFAGDSPLEKFIAKIESEWDVGSPERAATRTEALKLINSKPDTLRELGLKDVEKNGAYQSIEEVIRSTSAVPGNEVALVNLLYQTESFVKNVNQRHGTRAVAGAYHGALGIPIASNWGILPNPNTILGENLHLTSALQDRQPVVFGENSEPWVKKAVKNALTSKKYNILERIAELYSPTDVNHEMTRRLGIDYFDSMVWRNRKEHRLSGAKISVGLGGIASDVSVGEVFYELLQTENDRVQLEFFSAWHERVKANPERRPRGYNVAQGDESLRRARATICANNLKPSSE